MIAISVKNPMYSNPQKEGVNLDVVFEGMGDDPMPFTAMPNDVEEHGRILYAKAIAGEFGDIADWIQPTPDAATQPQPSTQGAQTL
jgi:hypothetical protein